MTPNESTVPRERDLPFVVVTHHPGDVEALAEEVWEVRDGAARRCR